MADAQPAQTFTLVESIERRSPAEVEALSLDRLLFELDLLFDASLEHYTQSKVAANELQATQRLRRLATKHEDARLADGLADDEAYMAEIVPLYKDRASAYLRQWLRHWRALERWLTEGVLVRFVTAPDDPTGPARGRAMVQRLQDSIAQEKQAAANGQARLGEDDAP